MSFFTAAEAHQVVNQPIDFTLTQNIPAGDQVFYSWNLFSWGDWLARSSSGPLLLPLEPTAPTLEVFEARAAAVIKKPIGFFTKSYLQNIDTVKKLDPRNSHQQLGTNPFTVQTTVQFPPSWSRLILAAKAAKVLRDKDTDKLEITSQFGYANSESIASNAGLQKTAKLLDIVGKTPEVIDLQGMVQFNQIAKFGTMITFFYALDSDRTLVVNYFALGLKKKDLNLGVGFGFGSGNQMSVRGVLLGENAMLNSSEGIGEGLPKYAEHLFESMIDGFFL